MPYYPELTLPDSTAGFKLEANIEAVSVISEISIYTDASAFGAESIECIVESTNIVCKNIGKLASNQTKHLKFAFVIDKTDYSYFYSNFGAMQIKRMDG